jgi:hypothetical protein
VRAYQCNKCKHCLDNDIDDTVFCEFGLWPGCGEPELCKEVFEPVRVDEKDAFMEREYGDVEHKLLKVLAGEQS